MTSAQCPARCGCVLLVVLAALISPSSLAHPAARHLAPGSFRPELSQEASVGANWQPEPREGVPAGRALSAVEPPGAPAGNATDSAAAIPEAAPWPGPAQANGSNDGDSNSSAGLASAAAALGDGSGDGGGGGGGSGAVVVVVDAPLPVVQQVDYVAAAAGLPVVIQEQFQPREQLPLPQPLPPLQPLPGAGPGPGEPGGGLQPGSPGDNASSAQPLAWDLAPLAANLSAEQAAPAPEPEPAPAPGSKGVLVAKPSVARAEGRRERPGNSTAGGGGGAAAGSGNGTSANVEEVVVYENNKKPRLGVILGSVAGGAVASALVILGAYLFRRRRRRRRLGHSPGDMEAGAPSRLEPAARAGQGSGFLTALPLVGRKKVEVELAKAGPLAAAGPASPGGAGVARPAPPSPGVFVSPLSSLTSGASSPGPPASFGAQPHPAAPASAAAPPSRLSSPQPHEAAAPWGRDQSSTGAEWGTTAGSSEAGLGAGAEGGSQGGFEGGLSLPWSDGVIRPDQIQILTRPDGNPWALGRGACGTVYKALFEGVQPVAVKLVHGMCEPRLREAFVREVTLLRGCRDRNVVQFIGACFLGAPEGGEEAMLVTEFMECGDLWKLATLRNAQGQRVFGWYGRGRRVALDVARGLHYLHSRRVVHLDLKSANILIGRDGTAKLADVGFARVLSRSHFSLASALGTWAWSAPEVLQGQRCTPASDIFSWGVVLWEICTGLTPIRGDMRDLRVPEDCPAAVAQLYHDCTALDPAARPTARQIVEVLQGLGGPARPPEPAGEEQLLEAVAAAAMGAGAVPAAEGPAHPLTRGTPPGTTSSSMGGGGFGSAPVSGLQLLRRQPLDREEGDGGELGDADAEAAVAAAWAAALTGPLATGMTRRG